MNAGIEMFDFSEYIEEALEPVRLVGAQAGHKRDEGQDYFIADSNGKS